MTSSWAKSYKTRSWWTKYWRSSSIVSGRIHSPSVEWLDFGNLYSITFFGQFKTKFSSPTSRAHSGPRMLTLHRGHDRSISLLYLSRNRHFFCPNFSLFLNAFFAISLCKRLIQKRNRTWNQKRCVSVGNSFSRLFFFLGCSWRPDYWPETTRGRVFEQKTKVADVT